MNPLTSDDIFKLIDLYFNEKFILYNYHWNSFNQFIDTMIKEIVNTDHIISEDIIGGKIYSYKIVFSNVSIKPPVNDNDDKEEIVFPEDCRDKLITYASKIIADIAQVQEIIDCENPNNEPIKKIIAEQKGVAIAKIPLMVRSEYCATNLKKDVSSRECHFDPGCYFIIKGAEKVVIPLERICENKMLCFTKKDSNYPKGLMYTCQVFSRNVNYESNDPNNLNTQNLNIQMKKDGSILLTTSHFIDIPIFIMFRALGIEQDKQIIEYIVHDTNDKDLINILQNSLNKSVSDTVKDENDNLINIKTQQKAQEYLISKLKNKRYSTTSIETNIHQKQKHLELLLSRDFLPHMGVTYDRILHKAIYLGKMVNKLISTYLGRIRVDDRDSFVNKRIDLPGALLGQLFRQFFKNMLNECAKNFKKKNSGGHEHPLPILKFIKSNIIEQGLTSALLTGTFGKKKGVAQQLQRLTYKQFVSYFRRIMPPPLDASNTKVVAMRHVNPVQYGYIDPVETPDGSKVGIHKHLALTCSVTINQDIAQIHNIKDIISKFNKKYVFDITSIPLWKLSKMIHININGEWIGVTDDPFNLVNELKNKRLLGEINIQTSINFNIANKSIDIYTDAGRLIRPLLRVENNELILTKDMLDDIDMNNIKKNKISRWAEFIQKNPKTLEYIDMEEAVNVMIAMYPDDIEKNKIKMNSPIDANDSGKGDPIDRYGNTYVKYTHCELHPMLFMGIISSNIPFSEHNQAPRNYFNFAQSRQGMGIYATNHRHRIDLSYLLYHPMRPLVVTRAAKYTNEIDIPAGENMIVAIACYTG